MWNDNREKQDLQARNQVLEGEGRVFSEPKAKGAKNRKIENEMIVMGIQLIVKRWINILDQVRTWHWKEKGLKRSLINGV
jgi:hypothetical protein